MAKEQTPTLTKKATVKKVATPKKKAVAKKATAKKTAAPKKTATKEVRAKKVATPKKSVVQKTLPKKTVTKKKAVAKKIVVKKRAATRTLAKAFAKKMSGMAMTKSLVTAMVVEPETDFDLDAEYSVPHLTKAEAIRPLGIKDQKPWKKTQSYQSAEVPELSEQGIHVVVRDPWWLYAYWEINPAVERSVRNSLQPSEVSGLRRTLRIYQLSKSSYWDIPISDFAESWYINTQSPGETFRVEVGILTLQGRFLTLVASDEISTPGVGPQQIDEDWPITDESYWELVSITLGNEGKSGPLQAQRLFEHQLTSGVLFSSEGSSPGGSLGLQSGGSRYPDEGSSKKRQFFLELNTELIVYGKTMPDADVSISGQKIQLQPDGSFSLRMHLPDGAHSIPVEAVSVDKIEKRCITPTVTRQTRTYQSLKKENGT